MNKLDKLLLTSFIGPFVLTFLVVIFILLSRQMLYYFDDIIGKDIGFVTLMQFIFYFILVIVPVALPLAVLLSSLITFGDLAEHFELTAIKSAGISPLRMLRPIFFFTLFLVGIAFWSNNYLAPHAALEAYTLLYDIKHKKPTLDIREGTFYDGMTDVSIKVDKKFSEDPAALKNIILYDHRNEAEDVFVADSGRMYTILNDRYMKFELYRGYNYKNNSGREWKMTGDKLVGETLSRSEFNKLEMVFDLSSFDIIHSSKELFAGNRLMRNMSQLGKDIDSISQAISAEEKRQQTMITSTFLQREYAHSHNASEKKITAGALDSLFNQVPTQNVVKNSTNRARQMKEALENNNALIGELRKSLAGFKMQWHKILANSLPAS